MTNYYEVLGVEVDADESTIKKAWAKLVRLHTPDNDPEGNRRIGEAKGVLLDPRARADHDAQLLYGEDIQQLFLEGAECMEEELYDEAILHYKEILALYPASLDARNKLGIACTFDESYDEAIKHFSVLVKAAPDSALYAANMAEAYSRWSETDSTKFFDAERWFKRATELESYNSSHFLSLSRLYRDQKMYDRAEWALESAIQADGKTDMDDLDTLMELTWIFLFSKQTSRIKEVAERIRRILPDDQEAREYAIFLFMRSAGKLAFEFQDFVAGVSFVQAAKLIDSNLGEYSNIAQDIENGAKVENELIHMFDDESIVPNVVTKLLAFTALRRLGVETEDEVFENLSNAASTWSKSELRRALEQCRRKYPVATESVSDVHSVIIGLGTDPTVKPTQQRSSSSSSGCGSGCVIYFVIALILGIGKSILGSSPTSSDSTQSESHLQDSYTQPAYSSNIEFKPLDNSSRTDNTKTEGNESAPASENTTPNGWVREKISTQSTIYPDGWIKSESESDGIKATKFSNPKDGALLTFFESPDKGEPVDKAYNDESSRFQADSSYHYELVRVRRASEAFHDGLIWNFKLSHNGERTRSRMIAYFNIEGRSYAVSLSYPADQPGRPYQTFFDPLFDEIASWR